MNTLNYENIGLKLDEEGQGWTKQERAEFGILSNSVGRVSINNFNQYDNSNNYLKDIKSKIKKISKIQDMQEQLKEEQKVLPWEN
jgi:hypothetical protein